MNKYSLCCACILSCVAVTAAPSPVTPSDTHEPKPVEKIIETPVAQAAPQPSASKATTAPKTSPTENSIPMAPKSQKTTITSSKPAPARTVTVSNQITKDMRGYNYVFSTYQPTLFTITVNDTVIEEGKQVDTALIHDELTITYYCEFQEGKRKSSRKTVFKVNPDCSCMAITFNWHATPRLIIDEKHAQTVSTDIIEV